MANQKITNTKKPLGYKEKRQRLDRQHKEYDQGEYTIDYAWKHFMTYQYAKSASPATIDYYRRFYKKFISMGKPEEGQALGDTVFGASPCNILSDDGIRASFVIYLQNTIKNVSQQTINAYLRAYRAFGNFCENEGYCESFKCPVKEVEAPLKDLYTDKELKKLLVRPDIENFVDFRNYAIITLILTTGARSNTILNIKICDFDYDTGYIKFNTTKAHRVISEGLDPSALRVLNDYVERWRSFENTLPTDYLFCNVYGKQLSRAGLCQSIAKYNNDRGVAKTSIHLFRHTFAKMWIKNGGDIITLARVLTHSELEMVKRYANLYDADVKEAIQTHSVIAQLKVNTGSTLKKRSKT